MTRVDQLRGDTRLEADRAILRRLTSGDLAGELADGLAQDADNDPLLGWSSHEEDW